MTEGYGLIRLPGQGRRKGTGAMNSAINTALSGAMAATMRLNASASNVANLRTTGPLPAAGTGGASGAGATGEASSSGRPYTPLQTVQTSLGQDNGQTGKGQTGGVRASYQPLSQPFIPEYQPDSPDANDQGLVAAPNVDLLQETVQQKQGLQSYKANLATLKAADQTQREAINLKV